MKNLPCVVWGEIFCLYFLNIIALENNETLSYKLELTEVLLYSMSSSSKGGGAFSFSLCQHL